MAHHDMPQCRPVHFRRNVIKQLFTEVEVASGGYLLSRKAVR